MPTSPVGQLICNIGQKSANRKIQKLDSYKVIQFNIINHYAPESGFRVNYINIKIINTEF